LFGILVIVLIIITNIWVTIDKNYFLADDYNYLVASKFTPILQIIHFLPVRRYNDRPVGQIIIQILFNFWGLRSQYYHTVFLLIHFLNCFLIYLLVKKILVVFKEQKFKYLPLLTVAIFGVWPKSLHAVSWIAAVFDLFGATILLLVMLFYLHQPYKDYRWVWSGLILGLFFLALRTKEVAIIFHYLVL